MKYKYEFLSVLLFACSVPFYFFGLFSLHTDRGAKLVGSLRFWQMGLTGDYDPYQQYFYTRLANFAQAVVVLLIFSLLFMVVFFILAAVRDKIKDLVVAERALFAFALLCFAFYCTAILIEILFYTNRFHASYILEGKGRLGFGVPLAFLLQCVAFALQYHRYAELVLGPFLERRRAHDQPELVNGKQIPGTDPPVSRKIPVGPAVPAFHYYLCCCGGSYAGAQVELPDQTEVKIGKDPARCQIVIDHGYKKVSRVHCGVLRKGKSFYVRDYSTNGTFMNAGNERLQHREFLNRVRTGQVFNLAQTENEFYCEISKEGGTTHEGMHEL